MGIAETGSGKTLAYVLPVLDRLKRLEDDGNRVEAEGEPRALVLVPTRELGEQVAKVFKAFTHDTRLRVRTVLGGQKARVNKENVGGPFEVLVATPGRLEKLLAAGALHLGAVRTVVLDEADELLAHGFLDAVLAVVDACPSQRQLVLLTATLTPEVEALAARRFADALRVQTEGSHKVVPTLKTEHVPVPDGQRAPVLRQILTGPHAGPTLLFANTRDQVDRIAAWLVAEGHHVAVLRGDMDPVERRRNLRAFADGGIPLLVATDAGARGLDLPDLARVVNVHLPQSLEAYLHRVGRTARAGRTGLVVNLVTPRDAGLLAQLDDGSKAPTPPRRGRSGRSPKTLRQGGP